MIESVRPPAAPSVRREPATSGQVPLQVANLFNTFDAPVQLGLQAVDREAWLDAFLLLAGLNQIAEDHLQWDLAQSRKLTALVERRSKVLARVVTRLSTAVIALRSLHLGQRRAAAWQTRIDRLLDQVADLALDGAAISAGGIQAELARRLLLSAANLPASLRARVVRMPACFCGLDQQPADCLTMAMAFAARWNEPHRPIIVVGARSSGSYLAPPGGRRTALARVFLRRYADVQA
jgi:hypothetical protein